MNTDTDTDTGTVTDTETVTDTGRGTDTDTDTVTDVAMESAKDTGIGGQLVVWLRFRPVERRVTGSIPDSTNFLTNSSGQATNAPVSLFNKQ